MWTISLSLKKKYFLRYCWRQPLPFAVTQTGPYTTIILTYHTKTHTSHQHLQIHITYLQTAIPLNPVHTDTLRLQIRILWRHNTKHNVTCSLPKCKHNYANHNTNTTFAKYKHNPEYNIKKLIFHNINTRQAYRCQLHTILGSMISGLHCTMTPYTVPVLQIFLSKTCCHTFVLHSTVRPFTFALSYGTTIHYIIHKRTQSLPLIKSSIQAYTRLCC